MIAALLDAMPAICVGAAVVLLIAAVRAVLAPELRPVRHERRRVDGRVVYVAPAPAIARRRRRR